MLHVIREKFMGWIAAAILGLIAVTFVFVGGANFTLVGSSYAAKVDGSDIGIGQFEQAYRDQLQRNPEFAQLPAEARMQLRRNVLEQLIQQRVVDNYLVEAGYRIPDEMVTRVIQQIPEFQVNGKFDIETYRDTLAMNGFEPSMFERDRRVLMQRSQLEIAVRGSAVLTPAEYRRILNLAREQRIVALATLDVETVADQISITEEMITAYYDDNPSLYQLPETADLQFVEILRSDVASSVDLGEDEILEHYESNKDRYLQDEQRQARHILVTFGDDEAAAEEKAIALRARIDAGEPFEDLARSNSEDTATAPQGGDLGTLTRSQLPGDLGGAIFAMQEGAIEGPLKSEFGFHIVRLDNILEQGPLPLEQVRAELTAELQDQKAESLFRDLERKMSDALFDAASIDAVAAAVGGEVKTVSGYSREGGEPLGSEPALISAVFDGVSTADGRPSDIIEVDAGRSVVFVVTNHTPATRQSLDEVRDQVTEAVRQEQAEVLMAARADEMIAALHGGADFATAAEAIGAQAGEPVLIDRTSTNTDPSVAFAVFTAAKPSQDAPTVGSTRNGEGGYTVYSVEAVLPGRPESIPVEQRDAGKQQALGQAGLSEYIAFIKDLRDNAEVIINDDAVAATDTL